jgi:hypothetical protein
MGGFGEASIQEKLEGGSRGAIVDLAALDEGAGEYINLNGPGRQPVSSMTSLCAAAAGSSPSSTQPAGSSQASSSTSEELKTRGFS